MKQLPPWKVKREVLRLGRQLLGLPRSVGTYLFSTIYYDLVLSRKRATWPGQKPWTKRVVVFVIFPTKGLQDSHLNTLRHCVENGYAPVVVSNVAMPQADRDRVLAMCASYIERPNFGYDFGAYRDGVLHVVDRRPDLVRLALLNDSVWYPLPGKRNWMIEAEEMGHDLVGAISNYGTPRLPLEHYLDIEWSYHSSHKNFHYASFALSFGPKILGDPGFRVFWQKFRMDNDKKRVVRRGEIGLTQWVLQQGFSHAGLFDPGTLDKRLDALSDERLTELTRNLILPEDPKGAKLKYQLLSAHANQPDRRQVFTKYILTETSLQGAGYVLADLMINDHDYPFLKKSPLRLNKDGADITLRLLADLPRPAIDSTIDEAKAIYAPRL